MNSKSTEIFMDQSDVSIRMLSISKCKHNSFMNCLISPRRMIKIYIDSSKEGSDCDYATNFAAIKSTCLFNLNIKPRQCPCKFC